MQSKQRNGAKQRIAVEQGCRNAADQADEGANREIKVVDRDDEHLGDGGQRNGHGILQHQVEAKVAHGAGLHIEGRAEDHREGNDGQQ